MGGLMVHCHAHLAGITHVRPTDDADIVVELQTSTYATHAAALVGLGFTPHESVDAAAPFHRFLRDGETVDLMVPDRSPGRLDISDGNWSRFPDLDPHSSAPLVMSFPAGALSASQTSHPLYR
ncbi:hypothetical protein [Luteococcus sp. OSA5]|uniref:hypothetical protein n=1 Tax=Luteococcus sp. OSA5 TaxID=3401630 RepID=UPI003B42925F